MATGDNSDGVKISSGHVLDSGGARIYIGGSTGATDNRILRADGTGGFTAQSSAIAIDDTGAVTGVASIAVSGNVDGRDVSADGAKLDLYPAVSALTTGQCLRATGAATCAFGALDLANANAVTGALPIANVAAGFTKADGSVAFTGDQSMGSHKLTNVTDPASAQDAATKAYADAKQHMFVVGSALAAQANTGVRFLRVHNVANAPSSTEADGQWPAANDGTLTGLVVTHLTADVDTFAYTDRINGVDTTITFTMASNGLIGSDYAHTAAYSKSDLLSVKSVQSATTAQASLRPIASHRYQS